MENIIDKIKVFVCVPGVGKTFLSKHDNNFVDIDELKCRYKYQFGDDDNSLEIEKNKGHKTRPIRSNTYKYVVSLIDDYLNNTKKILLLAPNPRLVELLVNKHIPYCLVYHSLDCIQEYKIRMKNRGNDEEFIESMLGEKVIHDFYKNNVMDKRPVIKIQLNNGEYLSDIFYNFQKFKNRVELVNKNSN